jgi:hypothetical protein
MRAYSTYSVIQRISATQGTPQWSGPRRKLLLTLKLGLALETKDMGGACYPRGARVNAKL